MTLWAKEQSKQQNSDPLSPKGSATPEIQKPPKRPCHQSNVETETARRNLNSTWTYGSSITIAETTPSDMMTKQRPGHPL
jgi:hypothetical protein